MANYTRVVYVNTRSQSAPGDLPDGVENIRDWSYLNSPSVRWLYGQPEDIEPFLETTDLIVLDWSSKNSTEAERACHTIRNRRADLPILILESYSGQTPTRDSFVTGDRHVAILRDPTDLSQIESAVATLGFILPPLTLAVHPDPNDPEVTALIESVGQSQLELIIQKHFPDGENAYIMPVGGGWSNTKLCRFYVDTDHNVYFLKFFTRRDTYHAELAQHREARRWLGDYVVSLVELEEITSQSEAFPPERKGLYPVCYASASTLGCPRETLKQLYRKQPTAFLEQALVRVLDILATNQPGTAKMEAPWTGPRGVYLTEESKNGTLEVISDFSDYGPPMFGGDKDKWNQCRETIKRIIAYRAALPAWLSEASRVTLGHIHGDPNPRNCLVSPNDPNDIRFIDCGHYKPDGRLVLDLALMERDIKLVLMATENGAPAFGELDATQIPEWCQTEHYSISKRLEYTPAFAPASPPSVSRAYRLVGLVRERAKTVSGNEDKEGRHYFAALLYWTLDVLKYPAVRPTKKLLALYSASEIIRSFE